MSPLEPPRRAGERDPAGGCPLCASASSADRGRHRRANDVDVVDAIGWIRVSGLGRLAQRARSCYTGLRAVQPLPALQEPSARHHFSFPCSRAPNSLLPWTKGCLVDKKMTSAKNLPINCDDVIILSFSFSHSSFRKNVYADQASAVMMAAPPAKKRNLRTRYSSFSNSSPRISTSAM